MDIGPGLNPIKLITPTPKFYFGVGVIKINNFFNPINRFYVVEITTKDIFGVNFGVNFNAQIRA